MAEADPHVVTSPRRRAIEAVNNWRGRCLDNFARAERKIIESLDKLKAVRPEASFEIAEAASNRTKTLRDHTYQYDRHLADLLDRWTIREQERNAMVHGTFSITPCNGLEWQVINELVMIRKGVVLKSRYMLDQCQAEAFLQAIIAERKTLEKQLSSYIQSLECELRTPS